MINKKSKVNIKSKYKGSEMREGQAKVLTAEELNLVQIVAGSGRQAKRDLVLLDFSFLLGLRVKEMAALMIEDVTEDNGQIKESFHLKADQAKGNKGRTVYADQQKAAKESIRISRREGRGHKQASF